MASAPNISDMWNYQDYLMRKFAEVKNEDLDRVLKYLESKQQMEDHNGKNR